MLTGVRSLVLASLFRSSLVAPGQVAWVEMEGLFAQTAHSAD